jgi:putative DNA primase/helicase
LGNLVTPKRVQKLQTALHAKAKAEADYRFYALYDKISREDILAHAYAQCRSNKGAPGVDGQTARCSTTFGSCPTASLTILRAFIAAGAPEQTRPLGGFESWSLVRDALVWLGEADPVKTMERTRAEDPLRAALASILPQWRALLGSSRVSVKNVIDKATERPSGSYFGGIDFLHPEFREALLAVAGSGGNINGMRLGKWLSANNGKVFDDLRIVPDGILEGVARYRLQHCRDGRWE